MNNMVSTNQNTLKAKLPIMIVALVAASCALLVNLIDFIESIDHGYTINLFHTVFTLAPYALFALYAIFLHNKSENAIFIPAVFAILTTYPLMSNAYMNELSASVILLEIPFLAFCVLATISALKGMNNKLFIIIALGIGVMREFISVIDFFRNIEYLIEYERFATLFSWNLEITGALCLYASLFLFCLLNNIPAIIGAAPEKEQVIYEQPNF